MENNQRKEIWVVRLLVLQSSSSRSDQREDTSRWQHVKLSIGLVLRFGTITQLPLEAFSLDCSIVWPYRWPGRAGASSIHAKLFTKHILPLLRRTETTWLHVMQLRWCSSFQLGSTQLETLHARLWTWFCMFFYWPRKQLGGNRSDLNPPCCLEDCYSRYMFRSNPNCTV